MKHFFEASLLTYNEDGDTTERRSAKAAFCLDDEMGDVLEIEMPDNEMQAFFIPFATLKNAIEDYERQNPQ